MEENNFEKSMENLENIVTELEKGELNLDESVKKFEEGMKIAKQCNNILENAEKKITILLDGERCFLRRCRFCAPSHGTGHRAA